MKKMDEMDRNIQMRSEEWGYKAALLSLCIWTLFNMYQTIVNETRDASLCNPLFITVHPVFLSDCTETKNDCRR